jgi:hypothetical protein
MSGSRGTKQVKSCNVLLSKVPTAADDSGLGISPSPRKQYTGDLKTSAIYQSVS